MCVIYNVGIMNGEAGPSGAVGTAIAAAPAVGSSVRAGLATEINTGVDFDNGLATFSGLGRMDAFGTPSMGIPEGPVRGDIFSNTEIIASNPNLDSKPTSAAEQISIFDNTSPLQAMMPVNEGPSLFSLKDTIVIAKTDEPVAEQVFAQPEVDVETAIESYFETSKSHQAEVSPETVTQAVEDMRTSDPLVYAQLKTDLESVDRILDLVDEIDPSMETAASISNQAIDVAVQRSGLVESIQEDVVQESEPETEAEADPHQTDIDYVNYAMQPKEQEDRKEHFVDQNANSARRSDTSQAIKQAFEESVDPETGKVNGSDVIAHLTPEPPSEEISEVVLRDGGKNDGSEKSRRNQIANQEFGSVEEAEAASERSIRENNAVTDTKADKRATNKEYQKVKNETEAQNEHQVYPIAA